MEAVTDQEKQEFEMTDKERVLAIVEGYILNTSEELRDAHADFGASVMSRNDADRTRHYGDKCKRLEGQLEAFTLVKNLIATEL